MTTNSDTLPSDAAGGLFSLEDAVRRLADGNDADGLGALLAARAGLDSAAVTRMLTTVGEGPVALVARTAGLSCNAYSAVLRFRHRLLRRSAGAPAAMLAAYPKLPKPTTAELRATLLVAFGEGAA